MVESITLNFELTQDDYVRVTRRLRLEAYKRPVAMITLIILIVILAAGSATFILQGNTLFAMMPLLLIVATIWFRLYVDPGWEAQRGHRLLGSSREVHYEFTNEYVLVKDSTGELKQGWSAYGGVITMDDFYILTFAANKVSGRYIPRRVFESSQQETAFRELLARKLNFKG